MISDPTLEAGGDAPRVRRNDDREYHPKERWDRPETAPVLEVRHRFPRLAVAYDACRKEEAQTDGITNDAVELVGTTFRRSLHHYYLHDHRSGPVRAARTGRAD